MSRPTITAIRAELRELLGAHNQVAASWATYLWDGDEGDEMAPLRVSYERLDAQPRRALYGWLRRRGLRVWDHSITGSRWCFRHVLILVPDYPGFAPTQSALYWQDELP